MNNIDFKIKRLLLCHQQNVNNFLKFYILNANYEELNELFKNLNLYMNKLPQIYEPLKYLIFEIDRYLNGKKNSSFYYLDYVLSAIININDKNVLTDLLTIFKIYYDRKNNNLL